MRRERKEVSRNDALAAMIHSRGNIEYTEKGFNIALVPNFPAHQSV